MLCLPRLSCRFGCKNGFGFIIHNSSFILTLEGLLREFARKGDAFRDVVTMAVLWK
jgi:hypothetical protein